MNNRMTKWLVRAVCLLLAAMMILGFAVTLLPTPTSAAAEKYPADMSVAIGIAYGASAPKSYTVSAPEGFALGYVHSGTFTPVSEVSDSSVTVYAISASPYRVSFPVDEWVADFDVQYPELAQVAQGAGLSAFPAFVGNGMCVQAGSFDTYAAASAVCEELKSDYGVMAQVASPTATLLTVFAEGKPVFAFDCANLSLGIQALQPTSGRYYMSCPDGYAYDGTLRFERYSTDAMTVASVLPIESYVEGVLPYEISSSWNTETQKAFAITVRSYTLANLSKHQRAYGFDLCNSTDCQVYRGVSRVNDTVRECVAATKSMVLTYSGKPIGAYYSSSTGGCTASAYDVWGGTSFPYLSANATPWEKYESYSKGSWTAEASPAALYEALKAKGYTGLTGNVAKIKINSTGQNSSYVNSITVTDVNGKSITISKCDRIRIALSKFLYSANFVVGKAGDTLSVTDYEFDTDPTKTYTVTGLNVRTGYGDKVVKAAGNWFNTATGRYWALHQMQVITSTGTYVAMQARGDYECLPDISAAQTVTATRTVKAQGSAGNFVFVGRGYGHGVGMSQYGAKDLGDLGYPYDAVLAGYFPLAKISNMTTLK